MRGIFKKGARAALAALALGALLHILPAVASDDMPEPAAAKVSAHKAAVVGGEPSAHGPTVKVSVGKATTVELPGPVADILVADPTIADVGVLRSDRLYVVGQKVGSTNVLAFSESGDLVADIAVHVRVDEKTVRDTLKEFFPAEDVQVKTVNEDVVLSGTVSNPSVANQVRDMAGRFLSGTSGQSVVDLMTVAGEQQVMLKVKIVEANRTALREYGIEPDYKSSNTGQSGFRFNGTSGLGLTEDPFALGSLFFDDNQGFGPLGLTLQALESKGLVNTLAEPNLTAISGETAGFLAGGEFPVPVGRDNDGNITIEFKQFGVSLNFTPVVLSSDRISLHLGTEVSALDQQNGLTIAAVDIPGLTTRRAETTVEIGSGGTLVIAGLIKSETVNSLNGLPGVQDVPVLGELFRSKSFNRRESEVLIIVTPYLVKPYAEAEAVRTSGKAPPVMAAAQPQEPVKGEALPQAVAVAGGHSPLAQTFAGNLKKVYGDRVPAAVGKKSDFGYLVD